MPLPGAQPALVPDGRTNAALQHRGMLNELLFVRYTPSSLNTLHVFPFVANFVSMAERLEAVLAELSEQPLDGVQRRCAVVRRS